MEPYSNGGPTLTPTKALGIQVRNIFPAPLYICLLNLLTTGMNYTGSISSNTSLHAMSSTTLNTVYFQAPNNSIMQLSVAAESGGTAVASITEVGVGAPGTRLETSGGLDPSDSFYYLYFQNATHLVQTLMQKDSLSGLASAGGTTTLPTIAFAGVGRLVVSRVFYSLCFAVALCLLL
jgi:hypothetical protein